MEPGVPLERSRSGRWAWAVVGGGLAVVLVGIGGASVASLLASQSLVRHHRVFTAPIRSVDIDASAGGVTVVPGPAAQVTVDSWGSQGLSTPTDDESVAGTTLTIRSNCSFSSGFSFSIGRGCQRNYLLHVPLGTSVAAQSGDGGVTVERIDGSVNASSGDGDITVRGGAGQLHLSSGDGDISASGLSAASVSASSSDGDVVLGFHRAPSRVSATSSDGDVTVELPRGPDYYQLLLSSADGSTSGEVASQLTSSRVIQASSSDGDVVVRYSG